MKRIVIFLLVLCCSLLSIAANYFVPASKNNDTVSLAALKTSFDVGHHVNDIVYLTPGSNGGEHTIQTSIDSEDEDDLLRKNALLLKPMTAFLYAFFTSFTDSGPHTKVPFYTFPSYSDSHRYIRLNVFRI